MKYKLEDDREYGPALANLTDIDGKPLSTTSKKTKPRAIPKVKSARPSKVEQHEYSKDSVIAYTDGACSGNPGPSGLGYSVVFPNGRRVERGEPLGEGTNNIAELTAIYRVLQIVEDTDAKLIIHTDSEYSIGVLSKGWKAKANKELISKILARKRDFTNLRFVKVRGHAGVLENELVDELARTASETQSVVER